MTSKRGLPAICRAKSANATALNNALNDESYQTRFGRQNPNLELVQRLTDAGVQIYVCGQSMGFRGYGKSELADPVMLAASAMTMVHQLQADGYTLQP